MKKPLAISYQLLGAGLIGLVACGGTRDAGYEAQGTVEVAELDLSPMATARVVAVRVDEGARVSAGDTLVLLTQTDLGATISAQRARVATAEANLRDLQAGLRPQEIAQAEAELAGAQAEAQRAAQALNRARALVQDNAIARQQYDDAVAANRVAEEQVAAARQALALARAGTRPERIAVARAEVANARAALEQVQARASDLVLTAPVSGIVLGRHAEPGEVLSPGTPVVTVGETGRPYVRVFVPQSVVRRLTLGDSVTVTSEGQPPLLGRIAAINPRAEFTPRVALTEEEREDLMFAVRIEFANPAEAPAPGLWVRVGVRGQGSGVRE